MNSHDPAAGARTGASSLPARLCIAGILSSLLAACAVGPDYVRPSPPHVPAFVRQEAAQDNAPQPAGEAFRRSFGAPLPERLVGAALLHNHDLRIALANYQRADALLAQARLEHLPTLTANVEPAGPGGVCIRPTAPRTSQGAALPDARGWVEYLCDAGYRECVTANERSDEYL